MTAEFIGDSLDISHSLQPGRKFSGCAARNLDIFCSYPLHTSTQYTYRLTHIPDQLQGRVNTLIRLLLFGAQTLGLLLTGHLLQNYGPVRTVLLLFLPQLALALLVTLHSGVRAVR
jgi:hypothetical protein